MNLLRQRKIQLVIITVFTILTYSNIFQNQLILDDIPFIVEWTQIRSFENIPDLLMGNAPSVHQGVFRPIRSLLYVLYYHLFGANPVGYHLHSLVVHLLSTVLVFLIVEQLLQQVHSRTKFIVHRRSNYHEPSTINHEPVIPFFASLLFGLHPIHTESITYIAASMEMTGVVFFFTSFYLYLKTQNSKLKTKYLIPSYGFAIGAFFTYEMTLTLPLIIVLYELTIGRTIDDRRLTIDKKVHPPSSTFKSPSSILYSLLSKTWVYFLLAGVYGVVRVFLVHAGSRGAYLAYSFYHTMLTMVKVFVMYIQLLLFPFNISYLHELAPNFYSWMTPYDNLQSILNQSLLDPPTLLGLLGILGLLGVAIFLRKRMPIVTFCIFWFFISLLPVSYIFPQGIALAEKYLYIPSFTFILLLVYLIFNFQFSIFSEKLKTQNSKLKTVLFLTLVGIYLFLTFTRNLDWRDAESFWLATHRQHPKSSLATYTLGVTYSGKKELEKAAFYYEKTIEIMPTFWQAHFNLGNTYLKQGKLELAKQEYKIVLSLQPNFDPALQNLKSISQSVNNDKND